MNEEIRVTANPDGSVTADTISDAVDENGKAVRIVSKSVIYEKQKLEFYIANAQAELDKWLHIQALGVGLKAGESAQGTLASYIASK